MTGVSDESLLAGMAIGDLDSAATLIRRLQSKVFGLAHLIVSDHGVAEDVTQEVFLRLWKHAQSYDPRKGSVLVWTLAITRNLALDSVRLNRELPRNPFIAISIERVALNLPEDTVTQDDDAERLRNALRKIPEEQRRAVLLAGLVGWTAKEIAEADDIPLGTAKTRIRDGLAKLRATLDKEWEDE